MYSTNAINDLYRRIGLAIDISDEMFEKAVAEYEALGKWIDKETPQYKISIYPQGSFALGTVVRPINDSDDYDIDLVCEFEQSYALTAQELKVNTVKPLLLRYKRVDGEIEEKRRCWHVEYEDVPNFHMDIIPAYKDRSIIQITEHDEQRNNYSYIGSNPAGYTRWFFKRCERQSTRLYENYVREHKLVVAQADVEKVKRLKVKTPLQRAIQLLKRHRDIMFSDRDEKLKPISIIITTVAAQLYQEEDSVYETLRNFLNKAPAYILMKKQNGMFYIENPSYAGDNFANKWNEHPDRAEAFFEWLEKAKKDLTGEWLEKSTTIEMASNIKKMLGMNTGNKVFSDIANESHAAIKAGTLKVDPTTGTVSKAGTISIPKNHHYGA